MKKIYYILTENEFNKNKYVVVCLNTINDTVTGIEEAVGIYPYRLLLSEKMEEIPAKRKKKQSKNWILTHAKIKGQKTEFEIFYSTKNWID